MNIGANHRFRADELGKEANRVEDARILGLRAVAGRAKPYVDPDPFNGSATQVAERLGVSRRTVFNWRQSLSRRLRHARVEVLSRN
jgi:hypothetical protein